MAILFSRTLSPNKNTIFLPTDWHTFPIMLRTLINWRHFSIVWFTTFFVVTTCVLDNMFIICATVRWWWFLDKTNKNRCRPLTFWAVVCLSAISCFTDICQSCLAVRPSWTQFGCVHSRFCCGLTVTVPASQACLAYWLTWICIFPLATRFWRDSAVKTKVSCETGKTVTFAFSRCAINFTTCCIEAIRHIGSYTKRNVGY